MTEKGNIDLPIFSIKTYVTYYCPDGLRTSDLQEAKEHGYGKDGSTATSFGHNDEFATFDYSVVPVIEKFSMTMERASWGPYLLEYYSDGEKFASQEVWYSSVDMEEGKLCPLVGTPEKPYNYIDQGVDEYIFERDGYVMVLSAMNWESYSSSFTGFRVKAEEFYRAWEAMEVPEPKR